APLTPTPLPLSTGGEGLSGQTLSSVFLHRFTLELLSTKGPIMSSTITGKQHIYSWMLMKVAGFRSLASLDIFTSDDKEWLKDLALEADLLHGIPYAIIYPDITDRDVDFLNRHARYYLSNARSDQPNYRFFKLMIYQLFELVASQRQADLQWPGPVLNDEERRMLDLESEHATSIL
ncbi:MAG: hypothetical protein ACYC3I_00505, partial [Gemmataceae bacterium]